MVNRITNWIMFVAFVGTVFCLGGATGSFLVERTEAKAGERSEPQQQVFAQTCSPGIIIRPNGAVLLDAWKSFDNPIPGNAGAVNFPNLGVAQPPSVHFGHTLPNELKVCFEAEEADGASCVPLFKLRRVGFPDYSPLVGDKQPVMIAPKLTAPNKTVPKK